MRLDRFEGRPRRRLLAAQTGEPDFVVRQRAQQRLHFADLAALVRVDLIKLAVQGLVLFERRHRQNVHQVELPLARHAVAVFIGLPKVVPGLQKQHGNVRPHLPQHMEDNHILRLKAARQARPPGISFENFANQIFRQITTPL